MSPRCRGSDEEIIRKISSSTIRRKTRYNECQSTCNIHENILYTITSVASKRKKEKKEQKIQQCNLRVREAGLRLKQCGTDRI
jgi:hypothetical protein